MYVARSIDIERSLGSLGFNASATARVISRRYRATCRGVPRIFGGGVPRGGGGGGGGQDPPNKRATELKPRPRAHQRSTFRPYLL